MKTDDDDELFYLLNKLHRSRNKWLKSWAGELIKDFFEKTNGGEIAPPVRQVQSSDLNN